MSGCSGSGSCGGGSFDGLDMKFHHLTTSLNESIANLADTFHSIEE